MAPIDEATKKLLTEQWLPSVRELRDQRKPTILVMQGLILIPVAVTCPAGLYLVVTGGLDLLAGSIISIILGFPAVAFVYLGKLQNCNDVISAIELSVYLGDRDQIVKSIGYISCFGKMHTLLRDIAPFLKGISG